ncbi:uncharacterized protein LOC122282257 [Carya illinoinensis]|uniref:uncharacterized protein LOC122282257 n=1 Tax=Carya illinoinensis TaxID=32201 RepID=UPI001C72781B|nr:uncharacterized protein LOC122282257 [Carya illinoinensis]
MPGIDNDVIEHCLGMDPMHKAVLQKRRLFSMEKYVALSEEVERLLAASFIREAYYLEWLSNVVLLKKKKVNGKWRMCVDFTNLNKAFPKDSFPLPRIDIIVDATTGYRILCFMDAYSAISLHDVSTVLVKEEGITQNPMYYVSRALRRAEARYPWMEMLTFALVTATRKLCSYFQAHTVRVLTEAPLAKTLRKPDSKGRLIGWVIELSEFNLEFEPRKIVKG